ncbi:MAG: hypothetical protein IKU25_08465 [Clostridia bacterium]|nr:hypothetical protein [Clostridia bacterium]
MSRIIYAIVALVLITSLAACTLDDVTNPTSATTTTKSSTTQTTTAITTTTEGDTTGNTSDTTTTITTTTKKTQQTPSGVVMYQNHPNVPDYGAMLGVTHSYTAMSGNENDSTGKQKVCFYFYNVDIIANADPKAESRAQYIDLISQYGYKAAGTLTDKETGLKYYGYENAAQKTIVLLSATPGYIIVGVMNY